MRVIRGRWRVALAIVMTLWLAALVLAAATGISPSRAFFPGLGAVSALALIAEFAWWWQLRQAARKVRRFAAQHDYRSAIAACDEMLRLCGDRTLTAATAWALYMKGFALCEDGRTEDGIDSFDELLAKSAAHFVAEAEAIVARTLLGKGNSLIELGRPDAGLQCYDEAATRFGNSWNSETRNVIAGSLTNKVVTLKDLGRYAEAAAAADDVRRRFGDASRSELRRQVVKALVNKYGALKAGGDEVGAAAAAQDVSMELNRQAGTKEGDPASFLTRKAALLETVGLVDEAVLAYDELQSSLKDSGDVQTRMLVARSMVWKAIALQKAKRCAEALPVFDAAIAALESLPVPEVEFADTRRYRGWSLQELGQYAEALDTWDELLAETPDIEYPESIVASATHFRSHALKGLGRIQEALQADQETIDRYADREDAYIRAWVTCSYSNEAESFADRGCVDEAISACEAVERRCLGTSDPNLLEELERVRTVRERLGAPALPSIESAN